MSYKRFLVVSLLIITIIYASVGAVFADSSKFNDIKGHWAEDVISNWVDKGLIKGYSDNTMQPDSQINRAEFITMVNRAFAISNDGYSSAFIDVPKDNLYYKDISAAKGVGYISGYPKEIFMPYSTITREQVAAMIARLLTLELNNKNSNTSHLEDYNQLSDWSVQSIEAVLTKGIMNGYQDKTFQPGRKITRAEAIVTIDRAVKDAEEIAVYGQPGTYGPEQVINTINGNVIISGADVTLQNTVITGNLLFAVGIGEGDVTLKNVTVQGNTIVKGGGSNSITLEDCTLPNITVTKDGVRIVASGNTSVKIVQLESGATLVEINTTGPGFENATISQEIPTGASIKLSGDLKEVNIQANINLEVQNGTIENMNIAENVDGSTVVLSKQSTVKILTADGPVNVKGEGKIDTANINSNNVVIEPTPVKTLVSPDVTYKASGQETPSTSGGGDSTERVQAITIDQQAQTMIVGTAFQLTVTFDPANATNKNITWESDNSVVAAVYSSGLVKAVGAGIATITATSQDGNKKATTRVTVNNPGAVDPVVARAVEATEVHKGATLAESTLTGKFKDADDNTEVTGTLAWIDEETVAAETGMFEWVFTPADITKYNVITGTASVTVKQGLIQFPGSFGPFRYTVTDGKAEITGYWYMSNPKDVVIPDHFDDYFGSYPVTSIGNRAFLNNGLTSVYIPDSVTRIGDFAFANNNLTSISIPNSVTSIGSCAFEDNQITFLNIPDSVTSIGDWAFSSNQINRVIIPGSVTSIGVCAFEFNGFFTNLTIYGVKGSAAQTYANGNYHTFAEIPAWFSFTLTVNGEVKITDYSSDGPKDVVIPVNMCGSPVTSIGDKACYGYQLTSVIIPGSVTAIGINAFAGNQQKPTDFTIYGMAGSAAQTYAAGNNHTFAEIPAWFSFTLISGEVKITDYSLDGPKVVVIPGNMCGYPVTSIGDKAFYDNQLTSVIIPNGVKSIGSETFANNQLTSVIIPGSVTGIGSNAFAGNQQNPGNFKIYGLKGSAAQTYADSNKHAFEEIFSYTINDGGAGIYNYSSAGPKDVVIPGSLGGFPVTKIWDHAFYGKHITSVTIPGSVTNIGRDAFSYNQLTSVTIPDGVTSVEGYAFSSNKLTSVSIPYSVSSIDMGVFAFNNLTRVYIPDSVKSIGDYAFNDNKLTSVTIPGSVTSIGSTAFMNQQNPANLTIYGVKGSMAETFANSNYYTFAEIPVGFSYTVTNDREAIITGYSSDAPKDVVIPADLGGYPVTGIGVTAFYLKGINSVTIPDSVKSIGIRAFEDNRLTSVTIPDSVTSIGNYAFFINWLSSVNIPNGVTSIGYDAFARNYLSSVTIPDSVTSIGSEAFAYNNLTSVIIPGGVTSIGSNAFEYNINQLNPAYLTIYGVIGSAAQTYAESYNHTFVGGSAEEFSYTVTNGEAKITEYNSVVHRDVVIPGTLGGYPVTSIGDHAFENKLLNNIIIPDSVTSIGNDAFRSSDLNTISIPDSVTSIGDCAFYGSGLDSITIPNGLTSIGDYVFSSNYLTSVTIPDGVTSIGKNAFYGNLLTSVTIPDSVTSIGYWAFVYNKLKSVTIPGSVTSIGEGAFNGNQGNNADFTICGVAGSAAETYADTNNHTFEEMPVGFSYTVTDGEANITDYSLDGPKDVVIPSYLGGCPVTSIGESAFSSKQLTSVFIPDSVTSIGISAFYNNKLTSVKILPGMTTIAGLAFAGNWLTSVIIPDGVTFTGDGVFFLNPPELTIYGVKGSAAQTYAAGNNHNFAELQLHKEFTINVTYNGGAKILGYSSDGPKDVVIPDNFYGYPVTGIVSGAFNNKQITSVIIPDGIKSIGGDAFKSNQLISVNIPNSVTSIGNNAFSNNQLTSAIIHDGVTSIGDRAFEYNKLTSVIIPDSVTSIGGYAFVWNQLTTVTIPGSVTSIGGNAFFANPWDMIIYGVKGSAAQTYAESNGNRFKEIPVGFSYTTTDGQSKITGYSSDGPKDVVIPDFLGGYPVTSIGDWAFSNKQLTSVSIPNRITSIGDGAFAHNQLTSVSIPDSITSIEGEVFSYNELTSISIPGSVTSIGDGAFESNRLTSLTIPGNVLSIGDNAFYNNQLTTVIIHDGVTVIGAYALADNQQNPADLTIYGVPGSVAQNYAGFNNHTFAKILPEWLWFSYTVTDGEAKITDYSIDAPKDVVIPDNLYGYPVTSFGGRAFAYKHLTSVIIPDGVTVIEGGAFEYNFLTSVIIPDSVTSIGERAFSYNQLTSVTIPGSVTSIGYDAFKNNQQNSADLTIYGVTGSAAQTYADSHNHTFVGIN